MCYDRKGRLIDLAEWARLHEDRDYLSVAQHWARGWMISTVWLGLDHGAGLAGAPVIFETMIFPPGDVALPADADLYQERYCTEAAARAGHDRALAWLAGKLGDDVMADIAGPLVRGSSDEHWDGDIGRIES
jgi:hypothetical protein